MVPAGPRGGPCEVNYFFFAAFFAAFFGAAFLAAFFLAMIRPPLLRVCGELRLDGVQLPKVERRISPTKFSNHRCRLIEFASCCARLTVRVTCHSRQIHCRKFKSSNGHYTSLRV